MTAPLMGFEGTFGIPGLSAAIETVTTQVWWGRWENCIWASSSIIAGAARDSGNTTTDILREGLLLGKVTSTGKLKEWSPTATDGTQDIYGVLGVSVKMQQNATNLDRFHGFVIIGGQIKASTLVIPGNAAAGISGDAVEYLVRAQLKSRFIFDDDVVGQKGGPWRNVVAKTADYTVTAADNGTLFTTRGASGAVIFTLPTTAYKGLSYRFVNVANQNMTITAGTADTLVTFNNAAADSVSFETSNEKIGGGFDVVGDGTGWLVFPFNAGLGATAQTLTVTDA